jgi:hypothetical protein
MVTVSPIGRGSLQDPSEASDSNLAVCDEDLDDEATGHERPAADGGPAGSDHGADGPPGEHAQDREHPPKESARGTKHILQIKLTADEKAAVDAAAKAAWLRRATWARQIVLRGAGFGLPDAETKGPGPGGQRKSTSKAKKGRAKRGTSKNGRSGRR